MKIGDTVRDSAGLKGRVAANIDRDEFGPECPRSEWGYLGHGVLVATKQAGIVHYANPDELSYVPEASRVFVIIVMATLTLNLVYAYFVSRPQVTPRGLPAFNLFQLWNAFWAMPFSVVNRVLYGEFSYSTWQGYAGFFLFLTFTWWVAFVAIRARSR